MAAALMTKRMSLSIDSWGSSDTSHLVGSNWSIRSGAGADIHQWCDRLPPADQQLFSGPVERLVVNISTSWQPRAAVLTEDCLHFVKEGSDVIIESIHLDDIEKIKMGMHEDHPLSHTGSAATTSSGPRSPSAADKANVLGQMKRQASYRHTAKSRTESVAGSDRTGSAASEVPSPGRTASAGIKHQGTSPALHTDETADIHFVISTRDSSFKRFCFRVESEKVCSEWTTKIRTAVADYRREKEALDHRNWSSLHRALRTAQNMSAVTIENAFFQLFMHSVICAAFVVSVWEAESSPEEGSRTDKTFEILETVFTSLFTAELLLNLLANSKEKEQMLRFISSGWSLLDIFVVIVSLLAQASTDAPGLSFLRLLRVFRIVRFFRFRL